MWGTTVERGGLQMGPTSGRYVGLNGLTRTPHRTCCPCTVLVQNGQAKYIATRSGETKEKKWEV